jgi:hypothetical protein
MTGALEALMLIPVIALSMCGILFWIRMMEDCLTRQEGTNKSLWCVLITGAHVMGATAYFFLVYRPRLRAELGLR